jgi:hypothetical protein
MRVLASFALSSLLTAACGPMPGYRGPDYPPEPADEGIAPANPPAPAEDEASDDGAVGSDDDAAPPEADQRWSEADQVPEVAPPRLPPPSRPAAPEVAPPAPAPDGSSRTRPATPPAEAGSSQPRGVRVIELDDDSAYILDDARGLCFFRHKASLAPVDCARVTEVAPQPAQPQPAQPAPQSQPGQPAAKPQPKGYSADQLRRFDQAFTAIFCDRIAKAVTPSDVRLREAGLDATTYEAIEIWTAEDDKRWLDLNTRASASCKPGR